MTDQPPSQPGVGQDDWPDADPTPQPGGRRWRLAAVAAVLLVAVGMASAWQAIEHRRTRADLEAAASVFEAARDAHAREVAPESWQKAAEAMDQAMVELRRQQERFVLFRSYPRVHELLTNAIALAGEAKTLSEAALARSGATEQQLGMTPPETPATSGSVDMEERTHDAIDAAKASLERANSGLARVSHCPRAMREIAIRRYVQRLGGTLEVMAGQVGDLDARFQRHEFFDATVAAESLKGKIEPILKDLDGMATKFRCKKSP
ncbi:MAG: hypothetical protein LAO05_01075 [Acidobacteriia bacterium]|nr:hypothetical protein [Terriglobia bacterium]